MNEYDPTSPDPTSPVEPRATTEPSVAGTSGVRRLLSNRKRGWIAAAVVAAAVIGVSGYAAASTSSPSTTATAPSTAGQGAPGTGAPGGPMAGGGPLAGGGGSNARSGPAAGGSTGTVTSVSTSGFTMSTPAGQEVTVNEASSTTYANGTGSTTASAITTGDSVLVLGTVNSTTITATQVTVQPTGDGSAASSAAGVVPFQRGTPSPAKQDGQIPANYTEGSGTIVSGTAANKATEAALAAYPGGVVDRVVQLSGGEYEVHYIGVNWPHHIFVDQAFTVVGAN
jgi:Domain of unknown function (DUF5666)